MNAPAPALAAPWSWRAPLAALLAALPWLNPVAYGPASSVVPWLASVGCALALWGLALRVGARPPLALLGVAALLVLWAWLLQPSAQQELAYLASGLGLILVGAAAARDADVSAGTRSGLLIAAALTALFGLCQYFGLSASFSPWMNYAPAGEAYGNLRQPNQYASLCWLGMAVLLWGAPRLPRSTAFGLAALLAIGSAASVSRTGMLQGLLLTVLAAAWPGPARRFRLELCALAALAYFGATLLLPFALEASTGALPARTLWGRLGGGESCSSRLVLWSNVLHLIAAKPWTGWGWGELDFAHFMTLYPGARFCDILDNAHSLPLHLAVELGLPAALVVCVGGLGWMAWQRPWREQDPKRQLAWALLAVILFHSLLEYPLWYGPFQITFGLALGWLLVDAGPVRRQARFAPAATAALLFAAASYAAWDYARVSQIYLQPSQRVARWSADPLGHARRSWLFANQARFAELTLASLSRENAARMYALSRDMLHYSPEPPVIERLIESATMTGRYDDAVMHLARFKAAFPAEYAAWRQAQTRAVPGPRRSPQG